MVEITLIMPIKNGDKFLEQTIRSILNQSFEDFELLCIDDNSTDNTFKIINYHSINDPRVKIFKNKEYNLMKLLNSLIYDANGKYILLLDSINSLKTDILEKIYKTVIKTTPDMILFKPSGVIKKDDEFYNLLSNKLSNNFFNNKSIQDLIFDIYNNPYHILYNKNIITKNKSFLNNNPYDYELFFYKNLLKSEKIGYIDQNIYETFNTIEGDYHSFEEYLATQNNIQKFFHEENYINLANNNKILRTITKLDEINIKYRKKAFQYIKEDYSKILDSNYVDEFFNSLNLKNRKNFEQIIISETVEEYDLLRKVDNDKKDIDFMKRYESVLKSEHQKIKNFNNSLVSSNSWKLTKIFRIIK